MKPLWLIEVDVPGVDSPSLQTEIRRQGMQARPVRPNLGAPFPRDLLGAEQVPPTACVLFLGTLPLMAHIQARRQWRPGGWCSQARLACSVYYAHLGAFLLNQRYTLLPCAEVVRQARRLAAELGREGRLFLRPDSARKEFSGRVVSQHGVEQALASVLTDPTSLVLVAEPQEVAREWRLVVRQDEVVAASQYREGGAPALRAGCPDEVRAFASAVLSQVAWRPDPLFMLDVGETPGGLRVIELNSFSCSGLYACELAPVVAAAAACARAAW